ncbi:hypothetical protein OUZ56_024832 [Daphnia magna]|uniref:Uncharacterized protein n=1 Tax=Daphnia magna TaxID=35525 RepID=A0ABQ9ZIT4_9CRUS|nr:hypothetical protein OUZ56_024832 [Daphnia magna]
MWILFSVSDTYFQGMFYYIAKKTENTFKNEYYFKAEGMTSSVPSEIFSAEYLMKNQTEFATSHKTGGIESFLMAMVASSVVMYNPPVNFNDRASGDSNNQGRILLFACDVEKEQIS